MGHTLRRLNEERGQAGKSNGRIIVVRVPKEALVPFISQSDGTDRTDGFPHQIWERFSFFLRMLRMGRDHEEPCSCTVPNCDCILEADINNPPIIS